MIEKTWFEGINDYKKCNVTYGDDGKLLHFHTELREVERMDTTNIYEILGNHLKERQTKIVEVCYSGGVDSEVVLLSCIHNKIPVRAITMRIKYNDILINTHDIYYSEKFCREHNIEHKFIDFDFVKIGESGEYLKLLSPYNIKNSQAAPHLWMLSQLTGFVVMGGDYSWPWIVKPIISPHQHSYNMNSRFMKDHGIHGISNMLSHSIDSNLHFIKSHVAVYDHEKHDPSERLKVSRLKCDVFKHAGFIVEPRIKAGGLESIPPGNYNDLCIEKFGDSVSSISWGDSISDLLGSGEIRYNDKSK
jgi:hypothetical protein